MTQVDSIIDARWVIPGPAAAGVLDNASVVIDDRRIVAVAPTADIAGRYEARQRRRLPGHALIPGLINAHTHAPMTLLRGYADDLPLTEWLEGRIWPAEQRLVDADFVRDGARLAIAEMLRGGTTCFTDMYFFPEVVAATAAEAGIRAVIGMIVIGFPSAWAVDVDDYLAKGQRLHNQLRSHSLVRTAFAPHAPYSVPEAALRRVAVLAEETDVPICMHVHETAGEAERSLAEHGARPLARLEAMGLMSPRLNAVHMTDLTDAEIERVAHSGVNVVHCPESNMKLASGICPVQRLIDSGVNVVLGTDGAASNNDLDMFGEMRSAALLAKSAAGDPTALPAERCLEMATLGAARALALDEITGSIEAGKEADLAAVDLDRPATQPVFNPVSQLVYAASREQVSDVWVAGRCVVEDGALTSIELPAALAAAERWRRDAAGAG